MPAQNSTTVSSRRINIPPTSISSAAISARALSHSRITDTGDFEYVRLVMCELVPHQIPAVCFEEAAASLTFEEQSV